MTPNAAVFRLVAGLLLTVGAATAAHAVGTNPDNAIIPLPLQPVVGAAQRTCSGKTASGLGFSELRTGTGPKVGATDYVLINYIGYLAANGQVFDQAMASPMQVNGVIPGFAEGLLLIPRGGVWRLCVPAALGYGKQDAGPIPANSALVFQIELVDSRTAAEVAAMRAAAQPAPSSGDALAAPPRGQ